MAANIKSHFEAQAQDNQAHLNRLMGRLEKLKTSIKGKTKSVAIVKPKPAKPAKSAKDHPEQKSGDDLDVTEDMMNMFVRLEV